MQNGGPLTECTIGTEGKIFGGKIMLPCRFFVQTENLMSENA